MPEPKKMCKDCLYWLVDCPECKDQEHWIDAKGLFQEVEDQKGTIEHYQERETEVKNILNAVLDRIRNSKPLTSEILIHIQDFLEG